MHISVAFCVHIILIARNIDVADSQAMTLPGYVDTVPQVCLALKHVNAGSASLSAGKWQR